MNNQFAHQDGQTRIASTSNSSTADADKTEANGHALPIGTQLFEFEITQVLGCGGFGIVYRATDKSLNREVALKEYMPTAFARRTHGTTVSMLSEDHAEIFEAGMRSFINEAKLLAQFDHKALVKVYRFWEANGTAYMVMPLYHGETLTATLRRRSTPPDEIWLRDFLSHLLAAIDVLHQQNCFHRDIAPDNILIRDDDCPVLLDFGAARHVLEGEQQSLTIILKPSYAPIEQYGNSPNLAQGPWTDLYALAAVIHLAIMGKVPQSSMQRLLEDKQPQLTDTAETAMPGRYSQGFLTAIDRALALKPKDRPQSVADFQALLNVTADQPVLNRVRPTPSPVKSRLARPLVIGISAACVLMALGFFIQQKPTSPLATNASANKITSAVMPAPAPSPIHTATPHTNSTIKDLPTETRNEHQQQLKILEEKQQAIASQMDQLALLKKEQETAVKIRLDKQQQQLDADEKRRRSFANTRPKVTPSATDTRVAEATKINNNDIKSLATTLPESETKQAQKIATEKSKADADLFVTPGF